MTPGLTAFEMRAVKSVLQLVGIRKRLNRADIEIFHYQDKSRHRGELKAGNEG
ncbi:MAG: hypothetical protein K2N34_07995 [Lachnospiraceae bacterium]|nr:hypothetical protein [Lachnospiraceae bacterium]